MNGSWVVVVLAYLALMMSPVMAQPALSGASHVKEGVAEPELAAELITMAREDQAVQAAILRPIDASTDPEEIEEERRKQNAVIGATFRRNTGRLKEVIDRFGWPDRSMVGERGANAAYLIVQHADHDRAFQRSVLMMMEPLVDRDEVDQLDYVYLYDRVQVGLEKPQRYGTQIAHVLIEGIVYVGAFPVEDRVGLDDRRHRVGLEPFEEYRQGMLSMENRSADTPDIAHEMTVEAVIQGSEALRRSYE